MHNDSPFHSQTPRRLPTRREFLWQSGGGLGGLALAAMLGRDATLAQEGLPGGKLHHPARAKRVVPAKEREYLDALVRGVYVKRHLPAGHVLTDDDVYLAVPLLKGQISTREFESGEVLKTSLAADEPVLLGDIDAHYVTDPEVCRLVPDRGMERRLPDMKVAVNQ